MTSNAAQSKMPMTIGAVLIIAAIGYYFYTAGNTVSTGDQSLSFDVTAASSSNALVGTDVLALLKKIHQLKIDYKFFESDGEQSLFDFSQIIPPENVGRPNPFLPIGNANNLQQANAGIAGALAASTTPPKPPAKKK